MRAELWRIDKQIHVVHRNPALTQRSVVGEPRLDLVDAGRALQRRCAHDNSARDANSGKAACEKALTKVVVAPGRAEHDRSARLREHALESAQQLNVQSVRPTAHFERCGVGVGGGALVQNAIHVEEQQHGAGTGEAANASEEIEIDDELGAMAIKETLWKLVAKADGLSDELRNRLDSLTLPPAPLDLLVNELDALFGTDRVVEITGRSGLYRKTDSGWQFQKRKVEQTSELTGRFQCGEVDVCVISGKASTGVSLHDSTAFPSRRRLHLVLELPFSATAALQAMGRTHRSDEHTQPVYRLLVSDCAAEKRFASTVSRRAAQLGAVTAAERRSNADREFMDDLLVGSSAARGMRELDSALTADTPPDWLLLSGDEKAAVAEVLASMELGEDSPPTRLLGRTLGVPYSLQNLIVDVYTRACQAARDAKSDADGDVHASDIVVGAKAQVVRDNERGISIIRQDVGLSWEAAMQKLSTLAEEGADVGFWQRELNFQGYRPRFMTALVLVDGHRAELWRPNGRHSVRPVCDLKGTYRRLGGSDDAASAWKAEFEYCKDSCPAHKPSCKCNQGLRLMDQHLLHLRGDALGHLKWLRCPLSVVRVEHKDRVDVCARVDSLLTTMVDGEA
mgnify:CR=1 FL=1